MTRARDVANLIGSGNYSSTTFTATAGQTAFTISHTQGFIQVFMNGLLLDETVDYTSNGSAVTLTSGAAAGDEIEVVAYNTFSVGDALNQAAADTRYVNATGDTMSGDLTVGSSGFFVDVSDDVVGVGTTSPATPIAKFGGSAKGLAVKAGQPTVAVEASANSQYVGYLGQASTNTYLGALGGGSLIMQTGTSGTTRINIDSSGRRTIPYQPSFSVRSNAGNSGNTWQQDNVIKFQTVQHNVGSHYSTSTGRFTAPVNGFYVFHYVGFGYNGGLIAATNTTAVALRRNGSTHVVVVYDYTHSSSTYPSSTGSVGLYLTANDYVDMYTSSQGQYADASNLYTHWSGYLLH